MEYMILIPPIGKPYESLTPEEAKQYFDWFIAQIPARREYLERFSGTQLDFSVKSLVDLWRWFLGRAEVERMPRKQCKNLTEQTRRMPREIAVRMVEENRYHFSLETEYILRDIAMYFGAVCVENNPSIHWGYHTDIKKDSFANRPLLMGFEDRDFTPPFQAAFDPEFTVRGVAGNILDRDAEESDLVKMYQKGKDWLKANNSS